MNELSQPPKDTSQSCIFDFPDRPDRPSPPIDPDNPPNPPTNYPYEPILDWPPEPPVDPTPGEDPIPGSVPHPYPSGNLHVFNTYVNGVYRPTGPIITTGVALFRKTSERPGDFGQTIYTGEQVTPFLAFPEPDEFGDRKLTFTYRSFTTSGLEIFWWVVYFNSDFSWLAVYDHRMATTLPGGEGSELGTSIPAGSVLMFTTHLVIELPSGFHVTGHVAQADNSTNTIDNDVNLGDGF